MTVKEQLKALTKEEWLALYESKPWFFHVNEIDIVSARWKVTAARAAKMADEAIAETKASGYQGPAYRKAQAKWRRAQRLDRLADALFEQLMKLHELRKEEARAR